VGVRQSLYLGVQLSGLGVQRSLLFGRQLGLLSVGHVDGRHCGAGRQELKRMPK